MTPSAAIQALNGRPGLVRLIDGVLLVEPLKFIPVEQSDPWQAQSIINRVCEMFDVPRWLLMSNSRSSRVSEARQATYFLLKTRRGLSTPQIGRLMGRDHTTVLFGIDAIKQRMACDPALKSKIEGCA